MATLDRYEFTGGTAVLTGAASGIGEHMAHGLAARGSDLVLVDRDAERLAAVAAGIRATRPDRTVDTVVADLADIEALKATAAGIAEAHPRITLLINNAGVALGGQFDQVSAEDFDWVMDINFRAPVVLTRLLLPRLTQEAGSHIVNLSSLFGLIGPPGQCAYSASKFALRGFSEVLRHELADRGVGVTTVHPGGIRTRIAENARVSAAVTEAEARQAQEAGAKFLTYPADKAAERILTAVEKRKGRVLIAPSAVFCDILARLFPGGYFTVLRRLGSSPKKERAERAPAAS
ncbi:SDR family NAD(P)-dependent oxidoreductase [Streptomyces sp. NBC_01803]|uniref:SDR family NAD(P)-dependent oxidoreductase n=1 Tax=Streptomyces sp. NBC_01803 TaxID=2975946 RepID=UPI002DD84717|nr:SDR family NAD(P)-dependent oxidoreductase [Streptomyces sp. NBC_01803]WSA44112.1 SDR family NAD(P)-dependent oxidoreductase [Streptomyces sp. NBC_01803]